MWTWAFRLLRSPSMRPAVAENGGFITTAVGFTSFGRTLCNCSAFSVNTRSKPICFKSSARRGESSLTMTRAPAFLANTASPPSPALGSSTTSPLRSPAAQFITKARSGGVENC